MEVILDEKLENQQLELTAKNLQELLGSSSDIIFKKIVINREKDIYTTLIYVDGLIKNEEVRTIYSNL
jgi:hypothetical protein